MSNSYRGDLYSVQNSPIKRRPSPPPPKKEPLIESAALALIAQGGKWVIFAIAYPFYLILAAFKWIATHIVPKVARLLSKAFALIASPLIKLARQAALALAKVAALVSSLVMGPLHKLSALIQKICRSLPSLPKPRFKLRMPALPTFKIPKIDLGKPLTPLKNLCSKVPQVLKPLVLKITSALNFLLGLLFKGFRYLSHILHLITNSVSLLLRYWGEQIKEMFSR